MSRKITDKETHNYLKNITTSTDTLATHSKQENLTHKNVNQIKNNQFIPFEQCINHKVPEYLSATIFDIVGERNKFNLRHASNIRPALTCKNNLLKSFIPSAIKAVGNPLGYSKSD